MRFRKETSAGGIVYRKIDGQLHWLVTQHSQNKHWGFPKGIIGDIHENEKMEEAALREVGEEGGITAKIVNDKPVKVAYKYRFKEFLVGKEVYYFLMEYVSGDPKDHDWEVLEAKFVPENEVLDIVTFKSDKEAFTKILELY
jgi:8-oxo-dGTP diphosphatase